MDRITVEKILTNYADEAAWVIGNTLTGLGFLTFAVCFFMYSKYANHKWLTVWLGVCLSACSVSRFIFVVLTWYDWWRVEAVSSLLTGMLSVPVGIFCMLEFSRMTQVITLNRLAQEIKKANETIANNDTPVTTDEST